jgi:hypothetical protein
MPARFGQDINALAPHKDARAVMKPPGAAMPPESRHGDLNWTQEGERRMLLGKGQAQIGNSGFDLTAASTPQARIGGYIMSEFADLIAEFDDRLARGSGLPVGGFGEGRTQPQGFGADAHCAAGARGGSL